MNISRSINTWMWQLCSADVMKGDWYQDRTWPYLHLLHLQSLQAVIQSKKCNLCKYDKKQSSMGKWCILGEEGEGLMILLEILGDWGDLGGPRDPKRLRIPEGLGGPNGLQILAELEGPKGLYKETGLGVLRRPPRDLGGPGGFGEHVKKLRGAMFYVCQVNISFSKEYPNNPSDILQQIAETVLQGQMSMLVYFLFQIWRMDLVS